MDEQNLRDFVSKYTKIKIPNLCSDRAGGSVCGGGGGHGPPDFADIEKRTEAEIEIDNLFVIAS